MSRKGYISDNLYDMRDRFKRNHAEHIVAVPAQSVPAEAPAEIVAAPASAVLPPEQPCERQQNVVSPRLPGLNDNREYGDHSRERRNLEGRLLRDLSFAEAESEKYSRKLEAAGAYRSVIAELLDELNTLDSSAKDAGSYAKELDILRIKYFHASGRFESENSMLTGKAESAGNNAPLKISQWPLALAIICSAVIVALTMLFIFGS